MKTIYYLILGAIGLILSIPMMIIVIAYQTANHDVDKMRIHLKKYPLKK